MPGAILILCREFQASLNFMQKFQEYCEFSFYLHHTYHNGKRAQQHRSNTSVNNYPVSVHGNLSLATLTNVNGIKVNGILETHADWASCRKPDLYYVKISLEYAIVFDLQFCLTKTSRLVKLT